MLTLLNLAQARAGMTDELDADVKADKLYVSPRLNDQGRSHYPGLLRQAIASHDDSWLADHLRAAGCFKATETRNTKKGPIQASVPLTAADTLAEGEFNRFYARGLCQFAIKGSIPSLTVYRAKPVVSPRPESEAMIGELINPTSLLNDLRIHIGVDTALGLPAGPNSGLSVRLL
jgi:hypothetical protein